MWKQYSIQERGKAFKFTPGVGANQSRLYQEKGGLLEGCLQERNGLSRLSDRFDQEENCIKQHFIELSEDVERKLRN